MATLRNGVQLKKSGKDYLKEIHKKLELISSGRNQKASMFRSKIIFRCAIFTRLKIKT